MSDDLVTWLREAASRHNNYRCDEAADRIEQLGAAINDWCATLLDWEGVAYIERIENETSRKVIEDVLASRAALGEKKDERN